jgi:phospholipase C
MSAGFDHLVVLMLENRSFDHMLGRLYHPENAPPYDKPPRGQSFDGIRNDMFNVLGPPPDILPPFPPFPQPLEVFVSRTAAYETPDDDLVGHQFPDVQMQVHGLFDLGPPMGGFVDNRVIQFGTVHPTPDQIGIVMSGFSPAPYTADKHGPFAATSVLSTLANQFAVCDNWFSSMPGPTLTNRSFLHAGTSNGWVSNNNDWNQNTNPTIINAMLTGIGPESAKIYYGYGPGYHGPDGLPCLTSLIHPTIPPSVFTSNTIESFCFAAARGTLPNYAFIEPQIIDYDTGNPPDDQHPPRDIRLGEHLISAIYQAVRNGPLWNRTLLVVTYDEHGGFFDHCVPPAATPPDPTHPIGEDGFRFDRFGVRVPAVLISPLIEAGTVFRADQPVDHTSVIKTLCNRWNLPSLTQRDANAPDLSPVLGTAPRPLRDTPDIPAAAVATGSDAPDNALNDLQRDYLKLIARRRNVAPPPLSTM